MQRSQQDQSEDIQGSGGGIIAPFTRTVDEVDQKDSQKEHTRRFITERDEETAECRLFAQNQDVRVHRCKGVRPLSTMNYVWVVGQLNGKETDIGTVGIHFVHIINARGIYMGRESQSSVQFPLQYHQNKCSFSIHHTISDSSKGKIRVLYDLKRTLVQILRLVLKQLRQIKWAINFTQHPIGGVGVIGQEGTIALPQINRNNVKDVLRSQIAKSQDLTGNPLIGCENENDFGRVL